MDVSLWMTFVAATVALVIVPGPRDVLVLTYALTQGRRVALAFGVGDLIAMAVLTATLRKAA
ncbi:hypothetical protein [Octadecabacter antarcticus]|nr:hypothetical protein [Octadecabacter antarcticus]